MPVLAVSFFTIIFSSLLWLMVALRYVADALAGISFFNAGITNMLAYVMLVCLPLLIMWLIFGYISQYHNNKSINLQLGKLFGQMKKNQDYSDLLARAMIETESQVKDGFILNRFDLLIGDMNELLSEIIHTAGLASGEQIERLWNKVQNGGKWSFGKVIIEVNNNQPDFQGRIYEKSRRNLVLGGTVMEFCARYQSLVNMLEKHDKDKVFLDMIETGVMGKVFSIFAPVADQIAKNRDDATDFVAPREPSPRREDAPRPMNTPKRPQATRFEPSEPRESILGKLFKKKPIESSPATTHEPDPFSMALERSFGQEEPAAREDTQLRAPRLEEPEVQSLRALRAEEPEEPRFEIAAPEREALTAEPKALHITIQAEPEEELSTTQRQLNSLKKEWEELGGFESGEAKAAPSDDHEENPAYPFGGWTDEQNYRK